MKAIIGYVLKQKGKSCTGCSLSSPPAPVTLPEVCPLPSDHSSWLELDTQAASNTCRNLPSRPSLDFYFAVGLLVGLLYPDNLLLQATHLPCDAICTATQSNVTSCITWNQWINSVACVLYHLGCSLHIPMCYLSPKSPIALAQYCASSCFIATAFKRGGCRVTGKHETHVP